VSETRSGLLLLTIPGIEDLEPVGRGGFGTVYRGWQPALGRAVAVKVLDAPATDAESEARFRREGRAMGALSGHPNVVPVFATGAVGDRLYLVMPMLEQGSLADQLAHGPLPPAEVAQMGRGLADALAAAHAAGVLHRDVKPANVLRTAYGTFQLADFGVARFVDTTQTMGGAVMATVAYAAPEVLAGEPSSAASDVYSLGATLHAALRGKPPYESRPDEAAIALAVRVLSDEPPDLRAEGVPPALAAVIERAMARDVADRWASAAELRDALAGIDVSAGASVPAAPAEATVAMAPVIADATQVGREALDPDGIGDATHPVAAVVGTSAVDDVPWAGAAAPSTHVPAPVAAAAPPMSPPTSPDRSVRPRSSGSRGPVLVALVLLIAAVAGALLLLGGDDGGGGDGDLAGTTASTAAPPSTEAPETSDGTPSTSASSETTPTSTPAATAGVDGSPSDALRSYYALMDAGRVDEGFARLSPAYQQRTGEDSYRGFWETVAGVEVLEVADDGPLGATATLRYTLDDGSTSTEGVTVRFVEDADGGLLIDDYRVG
jgi:hypothetical protein